MIVVTQKMIDENPNHYFLTLGDIAEQTGVSLTILRSRWLRHDWPKGCLNVLCGSQKIVAVPKSRTMGAFTRVELVLRWCEPKDPHYVAGERRKIQDARKVRNLKKDG